MAESQLKTMVSVISAKMTIGILFLNVDPCAIFMHRLLDGMIDAGRLQRFQTSRTVKLFYNLFFTDVLRLQYGFFSVIVKK